MGTMGLLWAFSNVHQRPTMTCVVERHSYEYLCKAVILGQKVTFGPIVLEGCRINPKFRRICLGEICHDGLISEMPVYVLENLIGLMTLDIAERFVVDFLLQGQYIFRIFIKKFPELLNRRLNPSGYIYRNHHDMYIGGKAPINFAIRESFSDQDQVKWLKYFIDLGADISKLSPGFNCGVCCVSNIEEMLSIGARLSKDFMEYIAKKAIMVIFNMFNSPISLIDELREWYRIVGILLDYGLNVDSAIYHDGKIYQNDKFIEVWWRMDHTNICLEC